MPIEHRTDHDRRIVFAAARDPLTDADFFDYQRTVWGRPEVAGYDELVDMSAVKDIPTPSRNRLRDLAVVSAAADLPAQPSKLAIVAPNALAFGLGRMYEAFRELVALGNKEVAVFRSRGEALKWLGVEST